MVTGFPKKSIVPVVAVSETPGYSRPSFFHRERAVIQFAATAEGSVGFNCDASCAQHASVADALLMRSVPSCTVQSPVKLWIFVRLIFACPYFNQLRAGAFYLALEREIFVQRTDTPSVVVAG